MSDLCDVGLYGLAVMGQNFALNIAEHGFRICVSNRSNGKIATTVKRAKEEGDLPLVGAETVEEFVSKLSKPRKIVILVHAGNPVDETIGNISQFMDEGDLIIDGGNEWYPNSIRRGKELEEKGIMFIGMGISGGEEGARNGPSLMLGGSNEGFDLIAPILKRCAAQVNDGPCTAYLGPTGAGNYIKMVHNGIEYSDMQLISEVYDILKSVVGMTQEEIAKTFKAWNRGDLESYLIEITAEILAKKDDLTGKGYVTDYILDKTGMKGTGRWAVQEAAEQSVAAPTVAAALDSRYLSGRKEERLKAVKVLKGPTEMPSVSKEQIVEDLQAALYASKVCSYAQGISLIKVASDKHGWNVNLSECARIWKGGCIIRANLLDKIQGALAKNANLCNLMVDPDFASELNVRQMPWRRIVTLGFASGIAAPGLSASLNYFDSYRRERLPANLVQAQRDFFGGHTYERLDRDGTFHCMWDETHKDIGDVRSRKAGEL